MYPRGRSYSNQQNLQNAWTYPPNSVSAYPRPPRRLIVFIPLTWLFARRPLSAHHASVNSFRLQLGGGGHIPLLLTPGPALGAYRTTVGLLPLAAGLLPLTSSPLPGSAGVNSAIRIWYLPPDTPEAASSSSGSQPSTPRTFHLHPPGSSPLCDCTRSVCKGDGCGTKARGYVPVSKQIPDYQERKNFTKLTSGDDKSAIS